MATLLMGCAATPKVDTTVATTGMPNPERALLDSVHQVDAEMTQLGTMTYTPPAAPRVAAAVVPDELNRTVTFSFDGPLDDGVKKVADAVGYRTVVTPAPPPPPGQPDLAPLTVSVSTGFATAMKVLNALGDAAGARALVRVDPQHHLVEVVHRA